MSQLEPRPGVPEKRANKILAHLAGVQTAIERNTRRMEGAARANLASHADGRRRHSIEVTRGKTDRFLSMVGPGAIGLEKGHISRGGNWVEGLRILENAVRSQVIG